MKKMILFGVLYFIISQVIGHAEPFDHPIPINLHQIMLLYFNSISWSILVGGDWSVRLFYPVYLSGSDN